MEGNPGDEPFTPTAPDPLTDELVVVIVNVADPAPVTDGGLMLTANSLGGGGVCCCENVTVPLNPPYGTTDTVYCRLDALPPRGRPGGVIGVMVTL